MSTSIAPSILGPVLGLTSSMGCGDLVEICEGGASGAGRVFKGSGDRCCEWGE